MLSQTSRTLLRSVFLPSPTRAISSSPHRRIRGPNDPSKQPEPETATNVSLNSTTNSNRNAAAQNFNPPPGTSKNHEKSGSSPANAPQSSASLKKDYAGKEGDDHPAKQPDPQEKPTRSTGFGPKGGVEGGKEGVKERTDR